MPVSLSAVEVLNREFLEVRCKILEVAAALDRLQRAGGSVSDDPRLQRIHQALALLSDNSDNRAEQVQLVFSRSYDDNWQADLKVAPR